MQVEPEQNSNAAGGDDPTGGLEIPLTLQEKLDSLPTDPGVYQFRDAGSAVIYVGKAKNLRNRVRSYFQKGRPRDAKTQALVRKIADVEIIVTDSAVEALILEDTLIKKLKPRYNVMLRDDKTYPYIRVTSEPFPRVFATRTVVRDGSRYFGPYTDVKYVRNLLKTLRAIFPIRSCDWNLNDETIGAGKYKVCLDYHIGKCEGPCEALVGQEHYNEMIGQVKQVLSGKIRDLEKVLHDEMGYLAEAMRFEEAAALRNRLQKLYRARYDLPRFNPEMHAMHCARWMALYQSTRSTVTHVAVDVPAMRIFPLRYRACGGESYARGVENAGWYVLFDADSSRNTTYDEMARRIVDGWINSPSHRKNLLATQGGEEGSVGLGIARGPYSGYDGIYSTMNAFFPWPDENTDGIAAPAKRPRVGG